MPRSRGSNRRPASASGYFVHLPKMPTVGLMHENRCDFVHKPHSRAPTTA